jgi:death-on-curing protein
LVASLAYGLAHHPFVDGNKRTAAVCCETFIRLNRAALQAGDLERHSIHIALAEGSLGEAELADWLHQRLVRAPGQRVNKPHAACR